MAMVVVVREGEKTRNLVSAGPIFPVGESIQFVDGAGRMHSIQNREVMEIRENLLSEKQATDIRTLIDIRKAQGIRQVTADVIVHQAIDEYLDHNLSEYDRG